eukprot:3913278-Prymnesium_polylepis.1
MRSSPPRACAREADAPIHCGPPRPFVAWQTAGAHAARPGGVPSKVASAVSERLRLASQRISALTSELQARPHTRARLRARTRALACARTSPRTRAHRPLAPASYHPVIPSTETHPFRV